ncbi:MAG: class I SAM-dependent methyltransferase [Actinomycetota bacterium]|nr:class I SAM-dependent methyltransferase [Actinomycetota bacterium]
MSGKSIGLSDDLHAYLLRVGVREPEVLRRLREHTQSIPQANMQIAPEQGAFMALLAELTGARRCLEVGTFTGYSSLSVALALPADGTMLCCDISEEWTSIARRYWTEARVADRIELRLGPALETLDALLADGAQDSFDFAFVDADKVNYPGYFERLMQLVRPGGVTLWDNVLWGGEVIDPAADDPDTRAIREINEILATDERVSIAMLPIADGLTVARKR